MRSPIEMMIDKACGYESNDQRMQTSETRLVCPKCGATCLIKNEGMKYPAQVDFECPTCAPMNYPA